MRKERWTKQEWVEVMKMNEKDPFVTRDLNCGRGHVFGRVAFIAVADITDAIAVTVGIAVVNFFKSRTTYCKT